VWDVLFAILAVLVVLGLGVYLMTPEERLRVIRDLPAVIRQVKDAAEGGPEWELFRAALLARTRWVLVTPALVVLNATIFGFMLFGAGALSDPETLVGWGANFGPRTTNGEWWRLVTTMFLHSGTLHLLVNLCGLVPLGLILERLVGPFAFAAVYVAAGVLASLVSLSGSPVDVSVGASGAIFGTYGLLLASSIWGMFHRTMVTIPLMAVKMLGPTAAAFILYNVATDNVHGTAELTGFAAGLVCGLVLGRGVIDRKPAARPVAAGMAATAMIAVMFAVPLRGVADVRPDIERIVAVEDRTASSYETAVDQFRKGRITAEALAQLIDRSIMPELQAAGARLKALQGVPPEHQPLVASAEEYVRLREKSWRLRAEGLRQMYMLALREVGRTKPGSDESGRLRVDDLHKANLLTLGNAETAERVSLEALQRIRPAGQRQVNHPAN
jgi:rhomboid protease GluP